MTDNIFKGELQGAKTLSTDSVVLIAHWLILHLKGPQGFFNRTKKFATQLHPYYRSGGGACSINSSCSSSSSRSSSGGRGNGSSFSGSSNNCSLSLSVTPSMSEKLEQLWWRL